MSTIAKPPVDVKGVSADGVGLVTGTTVAVAVLPDDEKLMAALATVAPLNVAVVAPGGILATCELSTSPGVTTAGAGELSKKIGSSSNVMLIVPATVAIPTIFNSPFAIMYPVSPTFIELSVSTTVIGEEEFGLCPDGVDQLTANPEMYVAP